ncbi:MAG TPA: prolyl oligopeptidase family serine peptidase, partial [Blastocatellia bacterium]|nr:prolyl oligopeptidase family serine peptidase [Blastocatellia bacterium]
RLKDPDLYVVNRDGSGLRKLSEDEAKLAPPASGELSKDKTLTLFTEDGDIFLYDHTKNERRQITQTGDSENNPRFTFDQKRIVFTRQNNLYAMALDGGSLLQLTDIRTGGGAAAAPTLAFGGGGRGGLGGTATQQGGSSSEQKGTDSQEFLKKEERELLEAVKERAQQREEREAKRKQREKRKPFQLPPNQAVAGLQLSPDEKYVIASIFEPGTGVKNSIVPNYVTESAYTEDIPARNKVGDNQGRSRMAIITVETGEVKFVDHGQTLAAKSSGAPTATSVPPSAAQPQTQAKPSERPLQLLTPVWSEDGKNAVLLARAADNKDRWVMALDPATAKTKVLFHEHDDAWIGGPGSFVLGWLPDSRHVYFQSERDGFAHLYTAAIDGGETKQLTTGKFEVTDVELAPDKSRFYLTTSEVGFGERHYYAMSFDGGARTKLTSMPGNNQVTIAPDQSTLAIIRSYSNKPPEFYLAPNQPGADAKQVTTSPAPEFFSYNWIDPPIINFKARDGVEVPARIYKPKNYQRGGPAVIFVHGAGYLQNVHKWWSQYYREYMFHHLLMERGFLVLDIDYRASAGYGRDWRTAIYRHMGGKDLSDHVDGAKYLVSEHGVDAKRIGIYGGSYGGFITLMAMFTESDVFAAGAALRPVTDWAHYNHPYTSNILNNPQADAEAYKRSSPIYHAQGLKGALLICHGMVDVNVHFQDSVRLAQRLIELRKENWELAVYPVEDHGFERASSWADEYKRILKLFVGHLQGNPVSNQRLENANKPLTTGKK